MKTVFVGYFSYATNYNRDLAIAFDQISNREDKLFLCGRVDENIEDNNHLVVDKVWRKDWRYVFDVLSYVIKRQPDVVYLHQEFKFYGGILTAFLFPLLIFLLRIYGAKVVVTVHAVIAPSQVNNIFLTSFNIKNNFINRFITIGFLRYSYYFIGLFANSVLVHSNILRNILLKQYDLDIRKVFIIESGVREIKNTQSKRHSLISHKFPILKNKKILLIFGFFSPRKGFEVIIKSFNDLIKKNKISRDYILVFAGDTFDEYMFYKHRIEHLISKLNISKNILITGYVNETEINEFFRTARLVILPAVMTFNISGALAAALAYGKPILASGVGPLKNEIVDNRIGITYDPKKNSSCQNSLKNILFDSELYNYFLRNVKKVAAQRYWRVVAKKHYDIFKKDI